MINISSRSTGTMVIFTLAVILAACGGGGLAPTPAVTTAPTAPSGTTVAPTSVPTVAPTSGSVAVDACALLTLDEVSTAFGETLVGAVPGEDDNYVYCAYGANSEVSTFLTKSAEVATQVFFTEKLNGGEAVPGVGDEAWWSTASFQPGLYFMKNGVLAFISGSHFGPEAPIIALGQLLASRM